MTYTDASDAKPAKLRYSDDELLNLLSDERRRSLGFEHDAVLTAAREKALNYYNGVMPDVPAPVNRSKAVDSAVRDAIDTILPDIQEMLTGGDDVAAFIPQGPEDEEAAQQETDYVNHVVFNENDGWMIIHTIIKDALQVKTGVVKYWWEDYDDEEETLEGKSLLDLESVQQDGEIVNLEPGEEPDTFNVTVRRKGGGKLCIKALPPEDFTVAADTVTLRETTYCAFRSRPRAQELIAQGIDPEIVRKLPAHATARNDTIEYARDTAGESEQRQGDADASNDLRIVEVVEHYIRLEQDGRLQLWRVLTGGDESVFIDKEMVDLIPIAAITPFVVTHRFYGESAADLLLEVQRIKTSLTRAHLDALYFALNQRMEVSMTAANEFTIADLLRNEPGMPVRSATGEAVRPISAGMLNFNTLEGLEYYNTVAEQRTGIVRAAQGLTPDTLHETAKGALALLTQAQKRTRMIARVFAETGIKDLFLGVHAMLRKHASQQATVRLRGKWANVAPTSWGQRNDMSIEIGLGASGREHDLMQIQQQIGLVQQVIMMQGGQASGPFVTPDNLYNLLKRFFEKTGAKAPEMFVSDPKEAPPQQPQPDPKMAEVQGKLQAQNAEMQGKQQLATMDLQHKQALAQAQAQATLELQRQKDAMEMAHEREMGQLRLTMESQQGAAELNLKREEMAMQYQLQSQKAQDDSIDGPHMGGEPG